MTQEDAIIAVFEAIADHLVNPRDVMMWDSKGAGMVTTHVENDVTNIRTAIADLKQTRSPITHMTHRLFVDQSLCGESLRTDVGDSLTVDILGVTCRRCIQLHINR